MDELAGTSSDAPSLASRLAARVTSHGAAQAAMGLGGDAGGSSLPDRSRATALWAARAPTLVDSEAELRQAADDLVDVAFVTPHELALWCAIRRHLLLASRFSIADLRQFVGTCAQLPGRAHLSWREAFSFLRELVAKVTRCCSRSNSVEETTAARCISLNVAFVFCLYRCSIECFASFGRAWTAGAG
jgi:hypothetical protein